MSHLHLNKKYWDFAIFVTCGFISFEFLYKCTLFQVIKHQTLYRKMKKPKNTRLLHYTMKQFIRC